MNNKSITPSPLHTQVATFTALLVIIFVLEIAAGILAYEYRKEINTASDATLKRAVEKYKTKDAARLVDWVQQELECCGNVGPKGYNFRRGFGWASPCGGVNKGVKTCHTDNKCKGLFHQEGCKGKLADFVKEKMRVIGAVSVGIAFVQIIGIVMAALMLRAIKWEYEVM